MVLNPNSFGFNSLKANAAALEAAKAAQERLLQEQNAAAAKSKPEELEPVKKDLNCGPEKAPTDKGNGIFNVSAGALVDAYKASVQLGGGMKVSGVDAKVDVTFNTNVKFSPEDTKSGGGVVKTGEDMMQGAMKVIQYPAISFAPPSMGTFGIFMNVGAWTAGAAAGQNIFSTQANVDASKVVIDQAMNFGKGAIKPLNKK